MDPRPPAAPEAATPADLITPHTDADPAPAGEAGGDLTRGCRPAAVPDGPRGARTAGPWPAASRPDAV